MECASLRCMNDFVTFYVFPNMLKLTASMFAISVNLALNKPAFQSNLYKAKDDIYDASYAVDGLKTEKVWTEDNVLPQRWANIPPSGGWT